MMIKNYEQSFKPRFNIEDFGAVEGGVVDCAPAVQAAALACDPNWGGEIYAPVGRWRLGAAVTLPYQGTIICGAGLPGTSIAHANGSSQFRVDEGITAFTCYSGAHGTLGYGFRNIMIRGSGVTGNGILVKNTERLLIEHVTCSDFRGGFGLRLDGLSGNCQYAELRDYSAGDCLVGLNLRNAGPNGCRLYGGYFEGLGVAPRSGSLAIHLEHGDTFQLFGTVIQGYETAIYLNGEGGGHDLHSPRIEYCNTGLRIGSNEHNITLFGGSFDNFLLASGANIGIQIEAGARDCLLMPTLMQNLASKLINNGSGISILSPVVFS